MTRRITSADAGCWIDAVNGWRAHYQAAELALSLGWLISGTGTWPHDLTGGILRAYRVICNFSPA
jgi:hypothetical protein